jgi:hypothetical protein
MNTAIRTLSLMALCCAASVGAVAQQQAAPAPVQATPTATATPATPPAATPAPATAPAAAPGTAPAAAPATKPARATAQSEAGDPRADTSNAPATAPAPSAAPGPSADRAQAARGSAARAAPAASGSGQKAAPKTDRLDLGTATVTGDREQPKVMYIVPWKRSDIGDLAGKPMNSLVDEILAPVDRDVFKREVIYYHAVQDDTSQNGAPPKPGQQGEK